MPHTRLLVPRMESGPTWFGNVQVFGTSTIRAGHSVRYGGSVWCGIVLCGVWWGIVLPQNLWAHIFVDLVLLVD